MSVGCGEGRLLGLVGTARPDAIGVLLGVPEDSSNRLYGVRPG